MHLTDFSSHFNRLELQKSRLEFFSSGVRAQVFSKMIDSLDNDALTQRDKALLSVWGHQKSSLRHAYANFSAPKSKATTSNKWARPITLFFCCRRLCARLGFHLTDGYSLYPDDFSPARSSSSIFNSSVTQLWPLVNPPYNPHQGLSLVDHVKSWVRHAKKTRSGSVLLIPHKPLEDWYRQITHREDTTVAIFESPLWFLKIQDGYSFRGPAPIRNVLLFIGVSGPLFTLKNSPIGYFSCLEIDISRYHLIFSPSLYSEKFSFSTTIPESLTTQVNAAVELEKTRIQRAVALTPTLNQLPQVNVGIKENPMFWDGSSPQFWHKLPQLLKDQVYGPHLQRQSRMKVPFRDYNQFIDQTKLQLESLHRPACPCRQGFHSSERCPSRIPSAQRLGLFLREDLLLYDFLLEVEIPTVPSPDGPVDSPETLSKFKGTLNARTQQFQHFWVNFCEQRNVSSCNLLPERFSFARLRYHLPSFWSLGYPRRLLFDIAFGLEFPFVTDPPPFECYNPSEISEDLWHLILKRAKQGRIHFFPFKFARCILPIFELFSSGKTRLIQDSRWKNAFLEPTPFSLPSHQDALNCFDQNDFLFVLDFSSFWSQLEAAPKARLEFASGFVYKGTHYCFVYTGTSFGNCQGPQRATELLRPACNVFSQFCPSVRYIDDGCGRLSAYTTEHDFLQAKSAFASFFWGFLGVRLNQKTFLQPRLVVSWCGKNIFSTLRQAIPHADKLSKILGELQIIFHAGQVTPRKLAQVLGQLQSVTIFVHPSVFSEGYQLLAFLTVEANFRNHPSWDKPCFLSPRFTQVCLHWFEIIVGQQHPQVVSLSGPSIFICTDAGNIRMGAAFFLRSAKGKHTLLHLLSEDLPKNRQVIDNCTDLGPASILREMSAIQEALRYVFLCFSSFLGKEVHYIELTSDSLGAVFAIMTKKTRHHLTRLVLRQVETLIDLFPVPVLIHWRPRSHFSQRLADLLTRISDASPNGKLKRLLVHHFRLSSWPSEIPFAIKDFTLFSPHTFQCENIALAIIPPHLPTQAYERIITFFFTLWQSPILVLCPFLRSNHVFQRLELHVKKGPTFTWTQNYFHNIPPNCELDLIFCSVYINAIPNKI